jgi:DNA-directed RNA polymerase subunit RPC12/RpoP
MRVSCLSCGNKIELDSTYGDYKGLIRCVVCGARLEIKTEEGGIRSVKDEPSVVAEANAGNRPCDGQSVADADKIMDRKLAHRPRREPG